MKKSIGPKTIAYPTPVFIVGSYDKNGTPNAMSVAWAGICCSKPPCIAVAIREATYTYGNIVQRQAFTISIPTEKYVKEADYFGIASGRNENKFSSTGLTPVKSEVVDAPYVKEFPFIIECKLIHRLKIGLHTQFIGEIKDIKVEENILTANGLPDIEKVKPIIFDPVSYNYYGIGKVVAKAFSAGKK